MIKGLILVVGAQRSQPLRYWHDTLLLRRPRITKDANHQTWWRKQREIPSFDKRSRIMTPHTWPRRWPGIELLDPRVDGTFSIGSDGTLYLPRLRTLYVEGSPIEEAQLHAAIQHLRTQAEVYIRPVVYRPVRVYVGGGKASGVLHLERFDRVVVSKSAERQQLRREQRQM